MEQIQGLVPFFSKSFSCVLFRENGFWQKDSFRQRCHVLSREEPAIEITIHQLSCENMNKQILMDDLCIETSWLVSHSKPSKLSVLSDYHAQRQESVEEINWPSKPSGSLSAPRKMIHCVAVRDNCERSDCWIVVEGFTSNTSNTDETRISKRSI